jgi:hypothetical protein
MASEITPIFPLDQVVIYTLDHVHTSPTHDITYTCTCSSVHCIRSSTCTLFTAYCLPVDGFILYSHPTHMYVRTHTYSDCMNSFVTRSLATTKLVSNSRVFNEACMLCVDVYSQVQY